MSRERARAACLKSVMSDYQFVTRLEQHERLEAEYRRIGNGVCARLASAESLKADVLANVGHLGFTTIEELERLFA